ncbi:MAG TPA: N-acetylmuramoyl-L-alanine amidase [Bacilli bacterium]
MGKWASVLTGLILALLLLPYQALAAVIVVDPGHGGFDRGATGVNGVYEKDVNLQIAQKLADKLREMGYIAQLTRNSDIYLSLQNRVDITAAKDADLFVSIHANAYPASPSVSGSMVLYFDRAFEQAAYIPSKQMRELTPQSKKLAQSIEQQLTLSAGTVNRGIVPSSVFVVRKGKVPSVLVETAFLTNPREAQLLASDAFQQKLATGIANGIAQFMPADPADISHHWAKAAILRLQDAGIIDGNKPFLPNAGLSRAEFAVMTDLVFHFADLPPVADAHREFADLPVTHPAYEALQYAVHDGFLQGYDDGLLHPDQTISREEMVVILDRIIRTVRGDADADLFPKKIKYFRDVPIDSWSAKAIYRIRDLNLIRGINDTDFAPKRSITKAEGAVIIDRYMQTAAAGQTGSN